MHSASPRIPSLHIVADNIPQAHFRAIQAVWEHGARIQTQYDRKGQSGEYLDPPSRDARVLIEIADPFGEPRYPPILHSEIGAYIAEIMGAKDHLVLSMRELAAAVAQGGVPDEKRWPYTYSGRLRRYPDLTAAAASLADCKGANPAEALFAALDSNTMNQIELAIRRIVETPHSRRAVMTTAIPFIDNYLREDVPCLREIQLRALEDSSGGLVLNMNTFWRSRDLYKAWPDNVIALTFLQDWIAREIGRRSGKPCRAGSYADYSGSLHIYGSYFNEIEGDPSRGLRSFFERHDEAAFVGMSMRSEQARDLLVLPELKDLLSEAKIKEWGFGPEQQRLIAALVEDLEAGRSRA